MKKPFKNYLGTGDFGGQAVALAINGLQNYFNPDAYKIASEGEIKKAVRGEPTSFFGYLMDFVEELFFPKKYLGACTQEGEILLSKKADKKVLAHEGVHKGIAEGWIRKPDYVNEEEFADRIADEYASKLPGGLKGLI